MVADAFTVPSSDTRANGRVWARAGYCATDESTSPAIRINSANIISTCQPSRQERSRTNTGGAGVSAAATATRIARDVAILARRYASVMLHYSCSTVAVAHLLQFHIEELEIFAQVFVDANRFHPM